MKVFNLEDLETFLEDYIEPSEKETVRRDILKHYCAVMNYKDKPKPFIESIKIDIGGCLGGKETQTFWRVNRSSENNDFYQKGDGGLKIDIESGVILSAKSYILATDGVVVDSFLGQGEALDCFNSKMQDAEATRKTLDNLALLQQLEVVAGIDDPKAKAEMYKKVFGECCDTPQTQILKP